MKDIQEHQWSMGNGQCPVCYGNKPDMGWWTDTVGHKKGCALAETMERAGLFVEWEHENPDRTVGQYFLPREGGNGILAAIRASDPDKEAKLKIGKKQMEDMWARGSK